MIWNEKRLLLWKAMRIIKYRIPDIDLMFVSPQLQIKYSATNGYDQTKDSRGYYYYQTRFAAFRINNINNSNIQKVILNQSALTLGLINKNIRESLNSLGYKFKLGSSQLNDAEVNALNTVNSDEFINRFLDNQTAYYKSLKKFKTFGKNWLNRVKHLRPKK